MEAEEVGEDRGGQVGGEGGQGSVAGGADANAMPVEQVGEAVAVEGLSGDSAGEQPAGCVWSVSDHERGRWLAGQIAEQDAEARRQQYRVAAGRQVGVASFLCELVGGEMADALGLEGEEEGEGASGPGLDGDRLVGQATLQELPALVILEQVCRFLARDGRDGELTAETTGRCPVQEVADAVAALGAFLVEPAVQVVLAELPEFGSLGVDPAQKVQGDQDPAT